MNTASIALTILIGLVVVLALLFWWLIRTFASMNKKEKEIFEGLSAFAPNVITSSYTNDLTKKPMQCPYDIQGRSCKYYNGATGYLDIDCKDCDWYNNGVRPSKL